MMQRGDSHYQDVNAISTATEATPQPIQRCPTFREVFETHGKFAWRLLCRLGVAEADAEDVAQEVFMVVHRKLATFEGRSTVRNWIAGICVRAASDCRRLARVRRISALPR